MDDWKKIKEYISSGKLGQHYGHIKTCDQDDLLANFEGLIMNIPYMTGYSPAAWQEGTIVMFKKRIHSANIASLYTIVLL